MRKSRLTDDVYTNFNSATENLGPMAPEMYDKVISAFLQGQAAVPRLIK